MCVYLLFKINDFLFLSLVSFFLSHSCLHTLRSAPVALQGVREPVCQVLGTDTVKQTNTVTQGLTPSVSCCSVYRAGPWWAGGLIPPLSLSCFHTLRCGNPKAQLPSPENTLHSKRHTDDTPARQMLFCHCSANVYTLAFLRSCDVCPGFYLHSHNINNT